MRKILLVLLVLLLVPMGLMAEKKPVDMTLTVLTSGDDPVVNTSIAKFTEVTGIAVETIVADISTGSTITLDTMIATGEAPDIYMDYLPRTGKLVDPAYAIALDDYINMSVFNPSIASQLKRGGKHYGIMRSAPAQGMWVNLDILDEAGYTIPDNWTTDDFIEMAQAVKAIGKYATVLFAANQSGDYFYMNWFASFGTQLYAEGYTESTADSPEGLATLEFLNMLVEEGYAPRESAVYCDDDYLRELFLGNCAVGGLFIGHLPVMYSMVEQGTIEKAPNYKFVGFPNGAAACSMPHAIVGRASGDDNRDAMIALLMLYIESKEAQTAHVLGASLPFPVRLDVTVEPDNEDWRAVKAIVEANGTYDLGLAHPTFGEIRKQMFPLLQEMYVGDLSPADAIKAYDDAVTAILQE